MLHCHPLSPHQSRDNKMTVVTLTKACELTNKSKRTIQRYMSSGKLSYVINRQGYKEIDTSELIRVFGDLSPPVTSGVRPSVTHTLSPQDQRIEKLISTVEKLEKLVEKQSEQIGQLLQIEHKKDVVTLSQVQEDEVVTTSQTKNNDYLDLDGMTFLSQKTGKG